MLSGLAFAQQGGSYGPAVEAGTIDVPGLTELSGLAASRLSDDVLWAHNDSGNEPLLYALGTDGKSLGSVRVDGASNVDWEDIASLEIDGEPYLVIGDVGDNDAVRPTVALLFVREPQIRGERLPADALAAVARKLEFRYEDGPRDCESIAVDTQGQRILLMSKRTVPAAVYEIPLAAQTAREVPAARRIADRVAIPRITPEESRLLGVLSRHATRPTGMDISADGTLVIVQTYADAFLFRRRLGQAWQEVFAAAPERVRIPPLRQGEGIAFDRAGRSVFAAGEHRPSPLIRVDSLLPQVAHGAGIDLAWHWEGAGESGARAANAPINPASVVKLATTLWALEVLGPQYRFRTTVLVRGEVDVETGVLDGDLIVSGGGDPDFHVESAQLIAQRLNKLGIRRVGGTLYVDKAFWIGWENGSEGVAAGDKPRADKMAQRLADAWDPRRWRPPDLRAMREFRASMPETKFIHLPVARAVGLLDEAPSGEPVVEHLSIPLVAILKRFNDFSNNDIERLGHHLGAASAMVEFFHQRWGDAQPPIRFETLSGLGSNRMSPRQVTRLIRDLAETSARHGLDLDDVLPVLGCGKNTLENYRGLLDGIPTAGLVGKTGTLVQTDGGVTALAGMLRTDDGDVAFFVVAPKNGARLTAARQAQTDWLLATAGRWDVRGSECDAPATRSYGETRLYLARSE